MHFKSVIDNSLRIITAQDLYSMYISLFRIRYYQKIRLHIQFAFFDIFSMRLGIREK